MWWRNEKPSPASYERRDLLAEAEAKKRLEEETELLIIDHFRDAYRRKNEEMDKLPEFGSTGECPACGEVDHVRSFEQVNPDYALESTPYNVMNVSCGSCSFPIGQEKAKNFTLPQWFRARRGLGYEAVPIYTDTEHSETL